MGIELKQWLLLLEYVPAGGKILSLGYPDLLLPHNSLHISEVPDADQKRHWHGWEGAVYDTEAAFRTAEWHLTCVDFKPGNNVKVLDLNVPDEDAVARRSFDALIDPGTHEHVADIWASWKWSLERVKIGGVAIHVSPVNCINHGFYSISPTMYEDLYEDDLLEHWLMHGPKNSRNFLDIKGKPHQHGRFVCQSEMWNIAVARITKDYKPPIQRKYR